MKRWFLASVACGFLLCVGAVSKVGAVDEYPDWSRGEPIVRPIATYSEEAPEATRHLCTPRKITVHGYEAAPLCVTEMDGWRYASYQHNFLINSVMYGETLFVVSLGTDSEFYAVNGLGGGSEPLENPGTNTLIVSNPPHGILTVFRNFTHSLERTATGYTLTAPGDEIRLSGDEQTYTYGTAIATGGRWLVTETSWGIVRVNLVTLETKLVSTFTNATPDRFSGRRQLAISDDGQIIVASGRPFESRSLGIISVHDDCGRESTGQLDALECPVNNLEPLFTQGELADGWPLDFRFTPHGSRLDLIIQGADGTFSAVSLYPPGSAPFSLRYLALGDSFSAGEGDSDHAYYLPHTDDSVTKDLCHTSRRSYPFILASFGGLEQFEKPASYEVKSVACSGAITKDILGAQSSESTDYLGQYRRLEGLSTAKLEDARHAALDSFIPGRVRQINFVDTYEPRAMSVGIGGNDIQFSQILALCAHTLTTCSYAGDPTDRHNLGESIRSLYDTLVNLYTRLSRASPSSRIFAIGYPRFINETSELCPLSTNLDQAERQMVDEGVRYLNAVTKAAAVTAGIAYIDIENALEGHRVCDDPGGYVNTIDVLSAARGHVDLGTFHPNELGQQAIATTIERAIGGGDLAAQNYCAPNRYPCPQPMYPPGLPTYFGDLTSRPLAIAIPSELLRIPAYAVPYEVARGIGIFIRATGFAPHSEVRVELHSEPLSLATTVTQSDGSADITILLPESVEPGYHTLHVYGHSPSGENVDEYQIIYVVNSADASVTASGATTILSSPTNQKPTTITENPCNDHCAPSDKSLTSFLDGIAQLPATVGRYWYIFVGIGVVTIGLLVTAATLWRRRVP